MALYDCHTLDSMDVRGTYPTLTPRQAAQQAVYDHDIKVLSAFYSWGDYGRAAELRARLERAEPPIRRELPALPPSPLEVKIEKLQPVMG